MDYNLIKLGGSIITDPALRGCFNKKNTSRLARELLPFHHGCILIHGTGHIGKPPAIKYNYLESGIIDKKDRLVALRIKESIRQLNHCVVRELLLAEIPAHPMDILNFPCESRDIEDYVSLKTMLEQMVMNGLVPVFYGDLLPLQDGNFKVISSDFITLILAKILQPDKVLFLTDVNGVYSNTVDIDNQPVREILPFLSESDLKMMLATVNDQKDVSGGMGKKVETALEISHYCHRCFIGSGYNRHVMHDFLNNCSVPGTVVKAENKNSI